MITNTIDSSAEYPSYHTQDVEKVIESYHCFLAKGINESNILMSVGKHLFDENAILISTVRPIRTSILYTN
jgi:hypothetical protein